MKITLEHWKTHKFSLEFARHTCNDRYTLRCGRLGVSCFVGSAVSGDASISLERIAACYLAFFGGMLAGYYLL